MATIVKTESGTWKALVRKTGWPSTSKSFRLKRDAEDWGRRIEDEMVRGVYIQRSSSEKMNLQAALERYEREIMPTKKASTQVREARRIKLLKTELGRYSLAALSATIVADYRDKRLSQGKSNNTVRLELALLSHLYTVAINEWKVGLPHNPLASVRKPSPGPSRSHRISTADHTKLLSALCKHSNPMLAWIYQIALETAMRASEIINLRIQDVDFVRRIIKLKDTKNGLPRTVPMTKLATQIFKQVIDYPMRPADTQLLFFGEPGKDKKRSPYQFNKAWLEVKRESGFKDLHFHDLRHEAISRFVEAGLTDQQVALISGHSSMQMVHIYTHLRAEDLVAKLDNIQS